MAQRIGFGIGIPMGNSAGGGGPAPSSDNIIQENNVGAGTFRMLTEDGVDLMIRE
jgi:hypothetical protein